MSKKRKSIDKNSRSILGSSSYNNNIQRTPPFILLHLDPALLLNPHNLSIHTNPSPTSILLQPLKANAQSLNAFIPDPLLADVLAPLIRQPHDAHGLICSLRAEMDKAKARI